MTAATLIAEYKAQKKQLKNVDEKLEKAKENITIFQFSVDFDTQFKARPKDKCVAQYHETFLSYDEYRYKDEMTTMDFCPNFKKPGGCKKTNCPGYQNYEKYVLAEKNYQTEKEKLWKYPLWVMVAACFTKDEIK